MTVCRDGGGFMPLDMRTISKLYRMDVSRRYPERDEKHLGRLFEQELNDFQRELNRGKQKAHAERMRDREERFAFEMDKILNGTRYPKYKLG